MNIKPPRPDAADVLLYELQERVEREMQYDRDDGVSDGHSFKWHASIILSNARDFLRDGKIDETIYTPQGVYTPVFTREGPNFRLGDFFTIRFETIETGVIGSPDYKGVRRKVREWRLNEEPTKIVVETVESEEELPNAL